MYCAFNFSTWKHALFTTVIINPPAPLKSNGRRLIS